MLILSRSAWTQRFLCAFNILIGLVIGWKSFNSWSLAPGGWWKEVYFFAYFYGILLALIILCENIIIQTKHSWLVGLSLTMSMYGLFSILWIADNGSFFPGIGLRMIILGASGAIIGWGFQRIMSNTRRTKGLLPNYGAGPKR